MFRILTFIILVFLTKKSFGATTAPSQIVPDVLDEIEKREIENQKNRKILPEIRELEKLKTIG